ncbi:hypothetical protein ES703_81676 [subsurface metagenome]
MNIEEVKQFIKQVRWGFLATTDGQKVGVRPMGGLAWKDNEFLCATFASSDKVSQLGKVPHAEYCFCDSAGRHICCDKNDTRHDSSYGNHRYEILAGGA